MLLLTGCGFIHLRFAKVHPCLGFVFAYPSIHALALYISAPQLCIHACALYIHAWEQLFCNFPAYRLLLYRFCLCNSLFYKQCLLSIHLLTEFIPQEGFFCENGECKKPCTNDADCGDVNAICNENYDNCQYCSADNICENGGFS